MLIGLVFLAKHGHRANAEFGTSAEHPDRNFTAVGTENFAEGAGWHDCDKAKASDRRESAQNNIRPNSDAS